MISKPAAPLLNITNAEGRRIAGSEVCSNCHKNIFDSFQRTAHYYSSQHAGVHTVKGSFEPPHNRFVFDAHSSVEMRINDSGLYQAGFFNGRKRAEEKFDIVIGSGTKGQTYLYWKKDSLFQLPIGFFAPVNAWVNSPGYPDHEMIFNRPVDAFCLGCHATNFKEAVNWKDGQQNNRFIREQTVLTIGCESCHGPGYEHVNFHTKNPDEKTGRYIINTSGLSRKQRLDACGACHSGMRQPLQPAFSFIPGNDLDAHSSALPLRPGDEIDVHGNQMGLLRRSKCFTKTEMDCSTCHNSHQTERNVLIMSGKCMNCHQMNEPGFCRMYPEFGKAIMANCIDCHMPRQSSFMITMLTNEGRSTVPNLLRTHWIKIYPEETDRFRKNKQP
jgi:hypothetical protein